MTPVPVRRIGRRRPWVDFHTVPEWQHGMHGRLLEWGRVQHGTPHPKRATGFISTPGVRAHAGVPVDREAVERVRHGLARLTEKRRAALTWYYVRGGKNPARAARELGVDLSGLAALVVAARGDLIAWRI